MQPPPAGVVREPGVGSAAGRPETGRHQVAGASDLAHPLRQPDLEGGLLQVAAGGDDGADAVVGVAVQMVDEVLAGEVPGAPARVLLPAEMGMGVDERRHHRAPGQVDDRRLGRRRHLAGVPDPHDQTVADDERGLLDDAAVTNDHAGAREQLAGRSRSGGGRRLGVRAAGDGSHERQHHQIDGAPPGPGPVGRSSHRRDLRPGRRHPPSWAMRRAIHSTNAVRVPVASERWRLSAARLDAERPPALRPRRIERRRLAPTPRLPRLHRRLLQLADARRPDVIEGGRVHLAVEDDGVDDAVEPEAARVVLAHPWAPVLVHPRPSS